MRKTVKFGQCQYIELIDAVILFIFLKTLINIGSTSAAKRLAAV